MALPRTNGCKAILIALGIALLTACSAGVPDTYTRTDKTPDIFPDYVDVMVPENIAPLNFMVTGHEDDDCVARLTVAGKEYVIEGTGKIQIPEDGWHEMLAKVRGGCVKVQLYVCHDGTWTAYREFQWDVREPVDRYVAYRLIPPSYTMYEELRLCQRDLTTYDEHVFCDNRRDGESPNQCINCHAFQNYDTRRLQLHVREADGGTIIDDNGMQMKRNLKRSYTIGAGAYPAWHPSLDLIAYSTDKTMQHFHSVGNGKVEVQDTQSDLILYDVKRDSVVVVSNEPFMLEVFPSWSPDGRWLYYSAAQVADTTKAWMIQNYRSVRYNIYRRAFDARHLSFGQPQLIVDAESDSLSALLPRVSPDGRYLLYSQAPYGVFHIWHKASDLALMDLSTNTQHPSAITQANSQSADSYHNWSSNGRWIVMTSRRDDDNYTRLYLTYFDRKGRAHKAFELPQEDPEYELRNMCSYNVPEFTKTRITKKIKLK